MGSASDTAEIITECAIAPGRPSETAKGAAGRASATEGAVGCACGAAKDASRGCDAESIVAATNGTASLLTRLSSELWSLDCEARSSEQGIPVCASLQIVDLCRL